ncbi:TniQ family protein [Rhizobium leguminosarum]|uniref:TniQ family protein n=1 Tax=Rhizobium leguminosarum TaxID=384 RepID=UPI0013BA357B|nr:TniQ family protein [Rhizobium leguminosarum]MBY5324447.1 TniQ family protein [Rhizobium leguminosarum]MBY5385727.1 TniQ family protein [Rhizobium leguminosarum]MCA2436041.1 TniQ family protein [Rhizobium leguminosarum]NEH74051.1 hypothetical protein [Rhizobium leguminosarum]
MSRLSVAVDFHSDETVPSFCSRLAAANGVASMREFCSHLGLNVQAIIAGDAEEVGRLMTFAGLGPRDANRGSVRKIDNPAAVKGEVIVARSYSTSRLRYCPRCLREDVENGSGLKIARPYGRTLWCFSFIRTCRRHEVGLQTIDARDIDPSGYHDVARMVEKVLRSKDFDKDIPRQVSHPFERYAEDRLTRENNKRLWIDEFPFYMVARLCEMTGAMEKFGKMFRSDRMSEADWADAAQIGFQIMSEGRAAFEDHLRTWHEPFWKTKGHVGGGLLYGRLYEHLAHESEDPAYDPIRKIMCDVTLDALPFGPGDYLFGPISKRRVHSVHSAALEYRIHPRTMLKLAENAGIIIPGSGYTPERKLMKAAAARQMMKAVGAAMDWEDAMARLGVTRTMWNALSKGYIEALPETSRQGMHALYDPGVIDTFIARATSKATLPADATDGLLPIEKIVKKTNCKFVEVIDLLLEERLMRAAVGDQGTGLGRLRFDLEEIADLLRLPDHGGLSLREISKRLTANDRVVRRLVDLGHLASEIAINPVKRCEQQIVREEALADFVREFVSLYVLAKERRENIGAVKRVLTHLGIDPAFPPEDVGARFYRRRDVSVI